MPDAATQSRIRSLLAEGNLEAFDEAVRVLVRHGSAEADAQREVFGIAPRDVATIPMPRGKIHMVRSNRGAEGVFWTYCGRTARGKAEWADPAGFYFANALVPGLEATHCRTCAQTLKDHPFSRRERQARQAKALGVQPWRCLRGKHATQLLGRDLACCLWCHHSPAPLFGIT